MRHWFARRFFRLPDDLPEKEIALLTFVTARDSWFHNHCYVWWAVLAVLTLYWRYFIRHRAAMSATIPWRASSAPFCLLRTCACHLFCKSVVHSPDISLYAVCRHSVLFFSVVTVPVRLILCTCRYPNVHKNFLMILKMNKIQSRKTNILYFCGQINVGYNPNRRIE